MSENARRRMRTTNRRVLIADDDLPSFARCPYAAKNSAWKSKRRRMACSYPQGLTNPPRFSSRHQQPEADGFRSANGCSTAAPAIDVVC